MTIQGTNQGYCQCFLIDHWCHSQDTLLLIVVSRLVSSIFLLFIMFFKASNIFFMFYVLVGFSILHNLNTILTASNRVRRDHPRNSPRLPPMLLIKSLVSYVKYSSWYCWIDDLGCMKTWPVQLLSKASFLLFVSIE